MEFTAGGVFAADSEVGRDLARVDWAATPLGAPDGWPQSLQTAVSILLSSRFSMWMAWGPELTFFCNAAYRRDTLGRKYPWALGRPASEVWAEIWDDIGPRIETVLTTGRATWDEALLLFLERSGYPEETYHTFSYSPLRDDDGAVVGMLCVVTEDTDRVIGERRMATLRDLGSDPSVVRTEREMLGFVGQQLAGNPRDLPFSLTYLFDDEGVARLAGRTGIAAGHAAAAETVPIGPDPMGPGGRWPAATAAEGASALVALDDAVFGRLPTGDWPEPPTQALVVPLLQQGTSPSGFLVVALNRYRPLDESYRGFLDLVAGHVAAGVASARSYQAQQRRAEELAELDRAKTAFFSNISHEFRTPLTLIVGPLEELRARPDGVDARAREELELIHRSALRLGKLVNSLLDFSRLEAGRMQAQYEPVDLAAVVAELASVFRSAVEKAGLTFEVDCPPLPEPVYIDRGLWEKVVLNLLSNALKFTFDGSVRVAVRADEGHAVVAVADTGIGVPEQEMPRLFERFHRIENARSRSNEGSGIGLALVKELVGLHGGTISAASVEKQGTTFTLRIPYGTSHLPAAAVKPASGSGSVSTTADPFVHEALRWLPSSEGVQDDAGSAREEDASALDTQLSPGTGRDLPARVLIADDNADMREYLARLLRGAGHRVSAVTDGYAALDRARAETPDLIISDVMMPGLDGLRLVADLRADGRTAGIPVLLLSARAGQEASIEGLEAGADDYLVKPFSAAELLARVQTNVKLVRLRNQHARWRTALVDSLQEAFFVCDHDGAVIEINSAFTEVLGFGPDQLPYVPVHPWWPDQQTDPEAHRQVADAFATVLEQPRGTYTIPVRHRDGHRLWVAAAFNEVTDPDTGRRVIVGTFRDVTAEHYAVQRESALAALSMRLTESESLTEALRTALKELQAVWHARRVLGVVFDSSGTPTVTSTEPDLSWTELSEERRQDLTLLRDKPPLTPTAGQMAGAGVCLDHPDGTMVLWIELEEQRPFTDEDQTLLALLAGHLGQGLHRVHQIDQQRQTALALQLAILGPAQLPSGFGVRYQPAAQPLKVGGDWYDTIELLDGRIGIVVGDCVGHGLEAATVMGQLRSACRALLLQDPRPAHTLAALDRFATTIPGALCTTVFCGVLDPATGRITYSSAGHPPGIVGQPDGTTRLLDQGRSLPLGVRLDVVRPEAEFTLPARAILMLYTDGLVERRREPLTAGIEQAAAAVQARRGDPIESIASSVMSTLAPHGDFDDDVALLLYRHPGPLELDVASGFGGLAATRAALRTWLDRCGLAPEVAQNVLVAAGEACANAIEHGNRFDSGGRIRLLAAATADDLHLTVVDNGRWKTPESTSDDDRRRGRGLVLMKALMDEVTITTDSTGTTVALQTRITG
ncbi:SpoIIE family protein phosphatase [Kribbella flavida]|uniref:SpoIIE family protein phosphatase n=1 Tax=Kribbella flavida TaxID=182640 RepID=UPI00030FA77B|nr:SpoIIE family protein phosphatase [Kribbella flavida]